MKKLILAVGLCLYIAGVASAQEQPDVSEGTLFAVGKNGETLQTCPLKNTSVKVNVSGFIARVIVEQTFENNFNEPIEAVYTFPLSSRAAVDGMTMKIGGRTILGKVLERKEARKVYEAAKEEGKAASLLDQERPNIFTQSIANIQPGESIRIEITYVETLMFDDGSYEFVFPMTVAPRYVPAGSDADDSSRISPPVTPTRGGHDISIAIELNAGVPVESIKSKTHNIDVLNLSPERSKIGLKSETTVPNQDFVLRYDVTGKMLEDALLVSRDARGGFFSLILAPPDRVTVSDTAPKEIVFVLDTSGSMSGFPIEKAKQSMMLALDGLYPDDTFNLITFAGDTHVLFEKPVPATQENLELAKEFLNSREGGGGTEMMDAIKTALTPSGSQEHIRIVCFMTDGQVGNDMEIIAEVKKHRNARVFSFGIGDSVNRFLLDGIANEGRGEAEYVMLEDDGDRAAKRFHERIRNPYLTDISIDWAGLPVSQIYPRRIPDLFGAKPVVIHGRYSAAAKGKIKLRGKIGGQPFERDIAVDLPVRDSENSVLASLWARSRVDELMSQSWDPEEEESRPKPLIKNQIVKLGVDFGIMTQFTSFVAVEERFVNRMRGGKRVRVPVYAPAGTAFEGEDDGTGDGDGNGRYMVMNSPASVSSMVLRSNGAGGGGGGGTGNGTGSGSDRGSAGGAPPPAPKLLSTPPATQGLALSGSRLNQTTYFDPHSASRISGGVLNGKAKVLPRPAYPAAARSVSASGPVSVQVTIDESGKVVGAKAVSGHPLLRKAAETAAMKAAFVPINISGSPVKTTGVLTYNFLRVNRPATAPGSTVPLTPVAKEESSAPPPPLTAEQLIKRKFHVWVFSVTERLKTKSSPTPYESNFVHNDKAEIQIVLTSSSAALIEKLKALGFEVTSEKDKTLIGRIPIEKLETLAEIEEIKYVLPQI